jgi:hypothetical protein
MALMKKWIGMALGACFFAMARGSHIGVNKTCIVTPLGNGMDDTDQVSVHPG